MAIKYLLLVGFLFILISIAIAKLSDKIGVPALLLFLAIGMLAGSERPERYILKMQHYRNR